MIFIGLLSSCGDDDEQIPEVILQAIAGDAQTVAPFTEVTLDGSASTGEEGFQYEWIYGGGTDISLSGANSAMATFTPEINGTYFFTLRITLNGEFSETQTQVIVTGAVVLDVNSFTNETLTLTNVNPFEDAPDYLINTDFTIPSGNIVDIASGQIVTIGIADGAGIIVNGTLMNNSQLSFVASSNGWKGILVDGGIFTGEGQSTIDKAGSVAFDGHEAAAITFVNNGSTSLNSQLFISNTLSDLGMVLTPTTSSNWDMTNGFMSIDASVPVKAPIGFLARIGNVLPTDENNYDYFHLTTNGAGVTEGSTSGVFNFIRKYFIDGDFTAGSPISTSNATIYMKEGTGIVGTEMSINSTTIEGLDGVSWKGIAASTNVLLSDVTINGAGSATHDTGAFTSVEKAAVYGTFSTAVQVSSCTITNSGGYGVYIDSQTSNGQVSNTIFTNTTNNDVILPFGMIGSIIKADNTWSSNTPVALRASSNNVNSPWMALGDGIAYLATENLTVTSSQLVLNPGVHIKFQTGTSLTVNTGIVAAGTMEDPIIFEGEADMPGSWKGILLQGTYKMQYCTINNGGGSAFPTANAANIVFGSGSNLTTPPQVNYTFDNNTMSNSAGFANHVLFLKYDPVTGNATNTYIGNAELDSDGDGIPDSGEFPGCELDPNC